MTHQHDLDGLERFMALALPLEEALVALSAYEQAHREALRDCEQRGLRATIQHLAMTIADLHNRP